MKKVQIQSTARAASFPLHRPTGQAKYVPHNHAKQRALSRAA
jgi:hypothetical protein